VLHNNKQQGGFGVRVWVFGNRRCGFDAPHVLEQPTSPPLSADTTRTHGKSSSVDTMRAFSVAVTSPSPATPVRVAAIAASAAATAVRMAAAVRL